MHTQHAHRTACARVPSWSALRMRKIQFDQVLVRSVYESNSASYVSTDLAKPSRRLTLSVTMHRTRPDVS